MRLLALIIFLGLAAKADAATYFLLSQTNTFAAGITNLAKAYTDAHAAPVGTVVNTGASLATQYAKYTDLTGTNVAPDTITLASADFANQGTTTTVLHGNASGNPSFGAVSLTADVSGTLPVGNLPGSGASTITDGAGIGAGGTYTLGSAYTVSTTNATPTFAKLSLGAAPGTRLFQVWATSTLDPTMGVLTSGNTIGGAMGVTQTSGQSTYIATAGAAGNYLSTTVQGDGILHATGTSLRMGINGAEVARLNSSGLVVTGSETITNSAVGTSEITINGPASPTAAKIVFNSGGVLQGGLFVPAANTYEFRNSTAAQRVNINGTVTDASNYRRGYITDSTAGVFDIVSEGLGTGATGNSLRLLTDGTARLTIASTGGATFGGTVFTGSAIYAQGGFYVDASGVQNNGMLINSAELLFKGGDVFGMKLVAAGLRMDSGVYVGWSDGTSYSGTTDTTLKRYAAGKIVLAGTTPMQAYGGTTASFPSIKRSSATLQARLADDSAYAVLTSGGVTDASAAAATTLGEVVSSKIAVGSAVSLTTATAANVTSISLTAGDWRVSGNVNFAATTATVTGTSGGITVTSATVPTDGTEVYSGVQVTLLSETDSVTIPGKQINVNATTTVYLVGKSTFSAGSVAAFGSISARRIR